jgi:hypothetical protein
MTTRHFPKTRLAVMLVAAHTAREEVMTVFMVERDLKGIAMEDLAGAQKAAIATAAAMRSEGSEVRYMHSSFVPGDGRCMCFFEGENAEQVTALNDRAGLPYHRVTEALDLRP